MRMIPRSTRSMTMGMASPVIGRRPDSDHDDVDRSKFLAVPFHPSLRSSVASCSCERRESKVRGDLSHHPFEVKSEPGK